MKDCKFLLDGKKFNSEEELENYIQNNYDLDSIGDYRFSKNLAEDAVKILSNVNKRNQEALHDIKNKYYSSTEDEVETYKDGYTAASEFVNDKWRDLNIKDLASRLFKTNGSFRQTDDSDFMRATLESLLLDSNSSLLNDLAMGTKRSEIIINNQVSNWKSKLYKDGDLEQDCK